MSCEDTSEDAAIIDGTETECTLALRQYGDRENPDTADGEILAVGEELEATDTVNIFLSKGPITDRNRDGNLNTQDVDIGGELNAPPSGATPTSRSFVVDTVLADTETREFFEAADGLVTVDLNANLIWGDRFNISYRGIDPDPATGLVTIPSGRQLTSTSWTFTVNVTRADRYAATAVAEDGAFNRGHGGIPDPRANGATTFEIDNELAGGESARTVPLHDAAGSNPVSITEPFFIELYWDGSMEEAGSVNIIAGNEAKEYTGDSSKTVTLTKAELDGTDVLDMAIRQTAGSWRIGIEDIGLGQHTLKYNAEDALGNTKETDRTLTFTVQPVPSWDLGLTAGMNLISLPSAPANGNVNEVFGDTEVIDLIFTFEGGQSKVALRNPDDPTTFVGTLTTIDAQHAYWISAENAATVEISIPPTSQLAPPPYLTVKGGQWNLLPVMSLGAVDDDTKGEGAAPGAKVDADSYLGDFRTAFGWTGRGWNKIDPDGETKEDRLTDGPEVTVGMGYWVLFEEDGIITP